MSMADVRPLDDRSTVSACPRCGTERKVYKCECEAPGRINPVQMPSAVAARLRELHRKAFPPPRLTATPNCTKGDNYSGAMTVWVEPGILWLRAAHPVSNADASPDEGWARLTKSDWHDLRDCVDKYFESIDGRRLKPLPERSDHA